MTAPEGRTFLAECYAPAIDEAAVEAAGARIRAAIAAAGQCPQPVAYAGAMLVPEDEVVFHVFVAGQARDVDETCRVACVEFARVVESVAVAGQPVALGRDRNPADAPSDEGRTG